MHQGRKSFQMSFHSRRHHNNNYFRSANRYGEGIAASFISADWMVDKLICEPKELEYLHYEQQVTQNYEELRASFSTDSVTSIDTARSLGVQREWEVYNFFADENINAPDELFVYVNDKGDVAPFSQEEIDLISMWKKGDKSPIEGIEGHHMELVKDNPTNIELAASPDNILFATKEGHRAHLHGGNTHNPTDPEYFSHSLTMDEQFGMTLDHNKDEMTLDFLEAGSVKVGGSMLLYGSLRYRN